MSGEIEQLAGLVDRLQALVPAIERALAPPLPPREVVIARPARFTKDRDIDAWIAARVLMDAGAVTSTRALYADYVRFASAPGASFAPRRRFVGRLSELPGVGRVAGYAQWKGLRLRDEDAEDER